MPESVAVIIGAGDATGGAIAKRFAREGYTVCVTRRSEDALTPLVQEIESAGGKARPFGCDARDEEQMVALFNTIENEVGPVEVVVFNIGANVFFSIRETSARVYRKVWEMAAFAGFLAGREAARVMVPRNKGTIIFTGATASVRGGKGFSAFAGAKFALRALAQSMARELGPEGIHVVHPIIDGAIDTAFIRDNFPAKYTQKEQGGILNPEHIADTYWMLHQQPRDAWTHEIDLRPWMETF
ncbi:MAG: SDR family oxidoreductase [Alcanivorax sp.]|nr:SDR family oxidoreductase [Alcanivorax sp.]